MTIPNDRHCMPELLLETVDGDKEIFLELAEIFFREGDGKFSGLKAAAAAGDLGKLGHESHSLKGVVGPLGAAKLVEMLQALENDCNQGKCVCDAVRISGIDEELSQVRTEMQEFMARL
jgi:HPt (histidine-containing phosphotransfer) domain-containing protein